MVARPPAAVPLERKLRVVSPQLLRARSSVPPSPEDAVRRPDLEARLNAACERRLTVVSAGAGWGKTVATAMWASNRHDRHTAWLTLEAHDDAPGPFWYAFLTALTRSGAVPPGHGLLGVTIPSAVTPEFRSRLFHHIETLPEPVTLVLDDFHVIAHEDVLEGLETLLRYPLPLTVVLLSRHEPGLPQHRLRVEGQLEEIGASELALDASSVSALARARGFTVSDDDAQRIVDSTGGWAVGVRLRLRSLDDVASSGDTDRLAAEYLEAEVLAGLSAEQRRFLITTSVASTLSAPLAAELVPGSETATMFEELVTSNALANPLDPDRTSYRLHPLLRDTLLERLQRELPEAAKVAHGRAARWLLRGGEPVRALAHAALAEDWALFGRVFVVAAPALVTAERESVLGILASIPIESLEPDAPLELCVAAGAVCTGRFEAARRHVARARALLAGTTDDHELLALLEVIEASAARGVGDMATAERAAAASLAALDRVAVPSAAWPAYEVLAANSQAVGLLWRGSTSEAERRFTGVVEAARDTPSLPVLNASSYLALCQVVTGSLDRGEVLALQVIDDARGRGWASHLQCRPAYAAVAWARLLRGEEDEAERHLALGLAATVGGVEPQTTQLLRLLQASVAVSRHRSRAALAAAMAVFGDDLPVAPFLADMAARTRLEVGLLAGRADLAADAGEGSEDPLAMVCRARAAFARGESKSALRLATTVCERPQIEDLDRLTAVEAWVLRARIHLAATDSRADGAIRRAVELAQADRLIRPFVVDRDPALVARLLAVSSRTVFSIGLRSRLGSVGPLRGPEPLVEGLTERELAILGALPTMQTNAEIAAQFFVSVNTVKAHLKALYRKLGVTSRREAVRRARELGLLK